MSLLLTALSPVPVNIHAIAYVLKVTVFGYKDILYNTGHIANIFI